MAFTGAFVVTDACMDSVDLSCIEVCPVDCIYAIGEDPSDPSQPLMVVIDPDECISCGKCNPECPVEAIHMDSDLPEELAPWIAINAMHEGRGDNDGPDGTPDVDKSDIAEAALKQHNLTALAE